MLLEIQKNMRGVYVVDQQRAKHSIQLWISKWWHRLHIFVIGSFISNFHILYKEYMEAMGLVAPMKRENITITLLVGCVIIR